MKVLITGMAGQLGRELVESTPADFQLVGYDPDRPVTGHAPVDITNGPEVRQCLEQHAPDLVINAAAYTRVDQAEAEPDTAFAVNSKAAAGLAEIAVQRGIRLIHISTDFVFDGRKSTPYLPGDPGAPLNVYGASKWEGEQRVAENSTGAALIIRSAWLYSRHAGNFVTTVLRLLNARDELRIVADQVGTPTWARSLAQAVWAAASQPQLCGIYHWTDAGVASWYDFAVAIQAEALAAGLLSRAVAIRPIRTRDYPTPARRPAYSVLDKTSAWWDFSLTPVHWRDNLRAMLREMVDGSL